MSVIKNEETITPEKIEEFLAFLEEKGRGDSSLQSYRRILTELCRYLPEEKVIGEGTGQEWKSHLEKMGFQPATVNTHMSVWNSFLRFLGRREWQLEDFNREKENAIEKRPAKIVAKMNSLCDPDIIKALYEAAAKGVKIQLIVRGICCLRTGIEGTNDNIKVRSIVGNFLEHARIFYFENAGNPELYMASADWMPRNLERRVEILFPVLHDELKEKVWHVLEVQLNDTQKAHFLQADGSYHKAESKGKNTCNAQEVFCKEYTALTARKEKAAQQARTFRPEYNQTIQN